MPEIDITKAAMEAAKKLNLKVEDEEVEEKPEETTDKEEEVEVEDEVPEEDEEVPEEIAEEPEKKGKPKMVPYSRLAETIKKMRTYERALQMMLDQQGTVVEQKKEVVEEKEEPLKIPEFDSPTEAMTWFMKTMEERQDKKIEKAIRKVVDPMTQSAAVARAAQDVEKLSKEHKDYFEHYDKMMAIAKRNPTLSAEEVYILAKGGTAGKEQTKKIVKKIAEKGALKKKANTEKRSSAVDRMEVDASKFKTVRQAAEYQAKKMGLLE